MEQQYHPVNSNSEGKRKKFELSRAIFSGSIEYDR